MYRRNILCFLLFQQNSYFLFMFYIFSHIVYSSGISLANNTYETCYIPLAFFADSLTKLFIFVSLKLLRFLWYNLNINLTSNSETFAPKLEQHLQCVSDAINQRQITIGKNEWIEAAIFTICVSNWCEAIKVCVCVCVKGIILYNKLISDHNSVWANLMHFLPPTPTTETIDK